MFSFLQALNPFANAAPSEAAKESKPEAAKAVPTPILAPAPSPSSLVPLAQRVTAPPSTIVQSVQNAFLPIISEREIHELLSRDYSLPKGSPSEAELDRQLADLDSVLAALPEPKTAPSSAKATGGAGVTSAKAAASHVSSGPVSHWGSLAKAPRDLLTYVGDTTKQVGIQFSHDMKMGEDVVRFVTAVERQCEKIDIKPDGHCLFRATAFSLIEGIKANPSHFAKIQASLDKLLDDFESLSADKKAVINDLKKQVGILKLFLEPSQVSTEQIINNQEFSDALVEALRKVSSAYNLAHPRDSFHLHLDGAEIANFNAYTKAMSDMPKEHPKFGGDLEAEAMSEIFGVNFLNFAFLGELGTEIRRFGTETPKGPFTVTTFYTGAHYDLLKLDEAYTVSKLSLNESRLPMFE